MLTSSVLLQAFYLARTGRPGPVLVDVPKDIQQQLAVPDWGSSMAIAGYMSRLPPPPQEAQLQKIVEALHQVRVKLVGHRRLARRCTVRGHLGRSRWNDTFAAASLPRTNCI